MTAQPHLDYSALDDVALARLCGRRDREAVRHLVTANNQRLFRAAWSILKDRAEAEEAVQAGYLSAFSAMEKFEGRSSLSTWLTRIVINEALGRLRSQRRRREQLESEGVTLIESYRERLAQASVEPAPDVMVAREQLRALIEKSVADLPDTFRSVFVLREIEGLSVEDTAEVLGIPAATVKTRLHRARAKLQQALAPEVKGAFSGSFPFAGADCAAMTDRVLAALDLT
ncbi:MAG: RNA polymerase sigma factor [Sphingomicrobium sp.]